MDLFVYGTLRAAGLMQAVAGGPVAAPEAARLADHAVLPLAGNVVPVIAPKAGAVAEGVIWRGLSADQMNRLDAYEGAFGYRLEPVTVATDVGPAVAYCYFPPADVVAGSGDWSLADWEKGHLAPAILAASELFAHDPLPDHASLRRMWPMIEARAWARHRATAGPASRRHAPADGDYQTLKAAPPFGQFFRFQQSEVQHRRFDGGQSGVLHREGFVGVDAAIVLPYDPVRDKVLLVEQARLGPSLRHDPNPWMLEPIAGIVDARETPEAAAHREGAEEAGLTFSRLEMASSFYVSPGASSDYFYCFVGQCDLPQDAPYLGGLDDEAEDLRLHPMALHDALDLAESGELCTGPALFLLYWLLRHRDRFTG